MRGAPIAAAFVYRNANDPGALYIQEQVQSLGLRNAVRAACELGPDEEDLVEEITNAAGQF